MQSNVAQLIDTLRARGLHLAIAESLTGGLLAAEFISVAGASDVVLGSITAYQNSIKQHLLSVPTNMLESRGAVSSEAAIAMASGVRESMAHAAGISLEKVIGISTTGVAGPDSSEGKPAGLVYLGLDLPGRDGVAVELHLSGDRGEIRGAAVASAVSELREQIGN